MGEAIEAQGGTVFGGKGGGGLIFGWGFSGLGDVLAHWAGEVAAEGHVGGFGK